MQHTDDLAAVQAALVPALVPEGAPWVPLAGGRSNAIWRVDAAEPLIAKLYRPGRANLLFPNDPEAEALALKALHGRALAPSLVARMATGAGICLVYRHVPGAPLGATEAAFMRAGKRLRCLHGLVPPRGLRMLPIGPGAILEQGDALLAACDPADANDLARKRPRLPAGPDADAPAFLHGDAVPANMIDAPEGLTLIDWQCPALGDPCEDIATFLSPAMQSLYGAGVPTDNLRSAFLQGYGDEVVIARYLARAGLFHWRMAAYCLWQAARGAEGYGAAARAEMAAH